MERDPTAMETTRVKSWIVVLLITDLIVSGCVSCIIAKKEIIIIIMMMIVL